MKVEIRRMLIFTNEIKAILTDIANGDNKLAKKYGYEIEIVDYED